VGHLPFAAWLIQEVKPKIFVELGTHSGNSYFTFCQSVAASGIDTKCFAVDTWVGDEHAGNYQEDIFQKVNAHNENFYSKFSKLLRCTFDNALSSFADESIDLLHIDGLHTYEAVCHDFKTWLPKLAPGAIVIFHDIKVYEHGFGVHKLWQELQKGYPNNIEFAHSHGLGVIQLHNVPEDRMQSWLQPTYPQKEEFINYFTALGLAQLNHYELEELRQLVLADLGEGFYPNPQNINLIQIFRSWIAKNSSLNQIIAEREKHIGIFQIELTNRDTHISNLDNIVSNLNQIIAEREKHIGIFQIELTNRDAHITNLNNIITTKDTRILELEKVILNINGKI
jgi:hypothetical protein